MKSRPGIRQMLTALFFKKSAISGDLINLYTLRFSKDLEQKYQRDTYSGDLIVIRILLLSGVAMYAFFALLDYMILGGHTQTMLIIRFAIVIPVILSVLALSYTKAFFRWKNVLLAFAIFTASVGIITMTIIIPTLGRSMYYSGLLLILFYNYILRIHFTIATLIGWLILLFYYLSFLLFPEATKETLWINLFFLTSINLIGMLASYSIEFFMRKNYLFSLELNVERQKVIKMNKELEERVLEKTKALEKDIEHRKIIEKDLIKAKEKAEESDRLKAAFLNNMSHEVRTPMNGILGFTDLLAKVDPHSAKFYRYISILKKSAHRLMGTVDDLIAISHVQTGQVEVSMAQFDFVKMLEDLIDTYHKKAKNKGLTLKYNHCSEDKILIYNDKGKVEFIISSFIKNAITFTNEGGVEVFCQNTDDSICISVTDTGIGIPKSRQEAIFNNFEKSDVQDIQAHQGSGLGLSLSLAYANTLNMSIVLDSEIHVGSTFSLIIPKEEITKAE